MVARGGVSLAVPFVGAAAFSGDGRMRRVEDGEMQSIDTLAAVGVLVLVGVGIRLGVPSPRRASCQ